MRHIWTKTTAAVAVLALALTLGACTSGTPNDTTRGVGSTTTLPYLTTTTAAP